MPEDIIRFIQSKDRFAITSHARPDGDSIASALGLAFALEKLGKTAHIFNADAPPRPYASLPGIDKILVTQSVEDDYDALFILECNNLERTGLAGLDNYFLINIDHHPKTEPYGNLNWMDPQAAAVGEMIYRLIKELEVPLSPEISINLYVAILTDTGSFQYSNTRSSTFNVASDLAAHGADPATIAQTVYMTQPYSRIELLGRLLNTLELHSSEQIALITLTPEMLTATGASRDDTEGFVNYPLSIDSVLLAAFIREEEKDLYRVSLRSKKGLDVRSVAEEFGGGGHKIAAGLSIQGSFQEARDKIISGLERLLEQS